MKPRRPRPQVEMDRLGEPPREPWLTPRFGVALLLIALGIAWIIYYYVAVRVDPTVLPPEKAGGPAFMDELGGWNYVIGFGAFFLGLMVSAHPSTPLGRGRGVVVGMLGCFLIGLIWICTYYVISDDVSRLPIFDDLAELQPGRRHRLHGGRLHLRHPLGVAPAGRSTAVHKPGDESTGVVIHRVVPSLGKLAAERDDPGDDRHDDQQRDAARPATWNRARRGPSGA